MKKVFSINIESEFVVNEGDTGNCIVVGNDAFKRIKKGGLASALHLMCIDIGVKKAEILLDASEVEFDTCSLEEFTKALGVEKAVLGIGIESITGNVEADFGRIVKASEWLTKATVGKDKTVQINSNPLNCGDSLLQFGTFTGDESIKTDPDLRSQACLQLASQVEDMMGNQGIKKK